MTLYYTMNDLNELENIIDSIQPDEYLSYFNDENVCDFIETILHLMDVYIEENPTAISEPDFNDFIKEEIRDILYIQFEEQLYLNEEFEDEMDDLLEDAVELYFLTICKSRNFENNIVCDSNFKTIEKNNICEKLEYLRNIPQPTQRTTEWYTFRHNLITASNAYKAFENQSTINQLIYEKCQPLKINDTNEEKENDDKNKMVNTNTTLHWGQKYEPLSVMIYEYLYNTKIEDFGCIQHKTYKFIGASPDGINIDESSDRYGRMLEIKNVVNREITGIPKKEYWIQMQLQMEVCDLDDCDFLETKFTEYPDYNSFYEDIYISNNDEFNKTHLTTKDGNNKGIIIYFHTKEGRPHYEYMPLNIITIHEINDWENSTISKYESEPYNYTFIKNIYWKLDKMSCIYVQRNKKWFEDNIKQLEKIWNIIEQERITGFEHRAPIRKIKKEITKLPIETTNNKGCLLNIGIKKFTKTITIDTEKLDLSTIIKNNN
jgi:putative phage-type endonuclease